MKAIATKSESGRSINIIFKADYIDPVSITIPSWKLLGLFWLCTRHLNTLIYIAIKLIQWDDNVEYVSTNFIKA
jgi:hypothetical protein